MQVHLHYSTFQQKHFESLVGQALITKESCRHFFKLREVRVVALSNFKILNHKPSTNLYPSRSERAEGRRIIERSHEILSEVRPTRTTNYREMKQAMMSFKPTMRTIKLLALLAFAAAPIVVGVVNAADSDGDVVEGEQEQQLAIEEQKQAIIGASICSCSPSVYEFTLDFSLSCPTSPTSNSSSAIGGDGKVEGEDNENAVIDATTCRIIKYGGQSIKDVKPVGAHSIEILELGQKLQIMKQVKVPGANFGDGYTFKYTSVTGGSGVFRPHNNNVDFNPQEEQQVGQAIVNPIDLPRAIQVNIAGVNEEGQSIVNIMMMEFNNTCVHSIDSTFPHDPNLVPSIGKQHSSVLGWTKLTDLIPPINHYCPSGLRKLL